MKHPRDVLLGAKAVLPALPVCDHYCGVEARMLKSLALQAEMTQEFGACVFDVTLDCEDGARVGGEIDHAQMVRDIANNSHRNTNTNYANLVPRVAARLHAVDHPSFDEDVNIIVGGAARSLCHLMIPKVESWADLEKALLAVDEATRESERLSPIPLHVLIESAAAVEHALEIAKHPRVQSLSFGLMDFVSSHGGAIPFSAMGFNTNAVAQSLDQFSHPLVLRAKLEISAACHAHGKIPSHCVVTEFNDAKIVGQAARRASLSLGYTRMWSIHPAQIRPILQAFAPQADEIDIACSIIQSAIDADWAPISLNGQLHDRASYRYFWTILERAHQTGKRTNSQLAMLLS